MALATGDAMPTIVGAGLDGTQMELPAATAGSWAVVLLYRGHW